ncbi:uncharacterized protein LOC116320467 isoform X5 [Oreochromis aureus]|uniref:uncharacterized protein LOC116320467 isoform X5 n=1 Tax=Oreochromis aureus TaxID=47969 RepID=UPI001952E1AC|nr:uncharacterized protein LOC116320467 isoform X5 [Oreochromis aureus]
MEQEQCVANKVSICCHCCKDDATVLDHIIDLLLFSFREHYNHQRACNYTNGKLMARQRYEGRIESNGAPMNHDITISNLTVDDSGVYTCVYKESANKGVNCKVYTVFVRGFAPRPSQEPQITTTVEERFLVMLLIICICVISILLIIIFILLIMQKVKQRSSCRRLSNSSPEESNDCVYEVMMKNNFYSVAALEQ